MLSDPCSLVFIPECSCCKHLYLSQIEQGLGSIPLMDILLHLLEDLMAISLIIRTYPYVMMNRPISF